MTFLFLIDYEYFENTKISSSNFYMEDMVVDGI